MSRPGLGIPSGPGAPGPLTRLFARVRGGFVLDDDPSVVVREAPPARFREIVRRFWPYARPYRWTLVAIFALASLAPVLDAATVWVFKLVVDDVLVPRDFELFWWLAAIYIGLVVVDGIIAFIDDYLSASVTQRFLVSLRTDVFAHLHRLPPSFFDRHKLGDLMSRVTSDVAAIERFVLTGVVSIFSAVLRLFIFGGILFFLSWRLALVSLVVIPAFWFASRYFSRLLRNASRERRRVAGSMSALAEESLGNSTLVQAYGAEQRETERFRNQGRRALLAELAATRIRGVFSPLVDLIEVIGGLLVLGFGTYELTQGRLSLGALLAFLVYLTRIYSPVRGLTGIVNSLFSAAAAAERVLELLNQDPAVETSERPVRVSDFRGSVSVDSVSFRYPGASEPALDGVSFSAERGEVVALVGPSGAGKTTLARLLLRFYDPDSGAVRLDGHDLRDLELEQCRSAIALLPQEAAIFDATIAENIAFGRPEATREEIVAAAVAADAHEFIMELEERYDTPAGQRGRRLSGGQRQRIAIARAMVREAPILLLDEPTTGLDPTASENIIGPLTKLMEERTTIVISHDLELARRADRIVCLDHGKVSGVGTHEELLARSGTYVRLWESMTPRVTRLRAVGEAGP